MIENNKVTLGDIVDAINSRPIGLLPQGTQFKFKEESRDSHEVIRTEEGYVLSRNTRTYSTSHTPFDAYVIPVI